MTPLDLISLALKQAGVLGVGRVARAEDANDALLHLNMMMGQWNRRRYLVYHLVDKGVPAIGASSYRVGPGQAIDVRGRVTKIDSAYWRFGGTIARPSGIYQDTDFSTDYGLDFGPERISSPLPTLASEQDNDFSADFGPDFGPPHVIAPDAIDYPLGVLTSREDWVQVGLKGQTGVPAYVWLDADFPVGRLYVWPSPIAGEIHVVLQEELPRFPDLTTEIQLPDEYHEALLHNLVVRLRSAYQRPVDPVSVQLAKAALNTIRMANAQVATLSMPDGLPGMWRRDNNMAWAGGGVAYPAQSAAPPAMQPDTSPPTFVPLVNEF